MNSNKIVAVILASIVVAVIATVVLLPQKCNAGSYLSDDGTCKPKPTRPHGSAPTKTPDLKVKNPGNMDPSEYGGIYARNGFGQKVDWWFLIKLPNKMMDPSQIQNMRLLPKDYVGKKPFGVYDQFSSSMGTNYTKGYVTAGIDPSTEFIQNWAPMDNMQLTLSFTLDDTIMDTNPKPKQKMLRDNIVQWLGVPVDYVSATSVSPTRVVYSIAPTSKSQKTADPADSVPSVNMWRAWLRIVHVMNILDTSSQLPRSDVGYDVTSYLNNPNPNLGTIYMDIPDKSLTGIAYDYTACGNPISANTFGAQGMVPDNQGFGLLQCTHCNNNGNDPANVWLEMPCNRVSNYGKSKKCWDLDSFAMLRESIKKLLPSNSTKNRLTALVSMYAAAQEPDMYNNALTIDESTIKRYIKILDGPSDSDNYATGFVRDAKGNLFTPDGKPIYGWESCSDSKCKPKSRPKSKKEYYDGVQTMSDVRRKPIESTYKKTSRPKPQYDYTAYRRGPGCAANDPTSSITYFLPPWAKVSESDLNLKGEWGKKKGLKHQSNPAAPATVGAGLASVQNTPKRGTGVCYVYADSNDPELKYFRWVENSRAGDEDLPNSLEKVINPGSYKAPDKNSKLDPLGQNKNDPVSKTLDQLFLSYNNADTHWSFWTDQMYSGGDGYVGNASNTPGPKQSQFNINTPDKNPGPGDGKETGTVYPHKGAGCSAPGAHSKGVLCYSAGTNGSSGSGFWLSTSVPMFPDISLTGMGENIRLGCQLDNNASFAQHLFCCSLDYKAMKEMLKVMKTVMACGLESPTCKVDAISGFNYGYGIDTNKVTTDDGSRINAYQCSSAQQSGRTGQETKDLTTANQFTFDPDGESEMSIFVKSGDLYTVDKHTHCSNSKPCYRAQGTSRAMYVPKGSDFLAVIGKSPADNRPPWAVVAQFLESDLSVSGWWDNLNGTPSYCAGRDYKDATNMFCLKDNRQTVENYSFLDSKNAAKFNIERIMALKIPDLPNPFNPTSKAVAVSRSFTQYGKMWYVGNHAKWGISTPRKQSFNEKLQGRRGDGSVPLHYVILGDMNGGGYPASKLCAANQFSRGGMFFVIESEPLWRSLANYIQLVCACNNSGDASNNFCGWGGYPGTDDDPTYGRKDAWDNFAKLPTGSSVGSFWTNSDKVNNPDGSGGNNKAWTRYGNYADQPPNAAPAKPIAPLSTGVDETIQEDDIYTNIINDLSQIQF